MTHKTHSALMSEAKKQSKVIALIYSPVELHEYIVEIITKDSDHFIHQGSQIAHFSSVDQALIRPTNDGAVEFFLCVDNTYNECGPEYPTERFDYIPVHPKYSH